MGYNPKHPQDMYNGLHKLLYFRYSLAVERSIANYKDIVKGTFQENPRWPCSVEIQRLPTIVSYLPSAKRRLVTGFSLESRRTTRVGDDRPDKTFIKPPVRRRTKFASGGHAQWLTVNGTSSPSKTGRQLSRAYRVSPLRPVSAAMSSGKSPKENRYSHPSCDNHVSCRKTPGSRKDKLPRITITNVKRRKPYRSERPKSPSMVVRDASTIIRRVYPAV